MHAMYNEKILSVLIIRKVVGTCKIICTSILSDMMYLHINNVPFSVAESMKILLSD